MNNLFLYMIVLLAFVLPPIILINLNKIGKETETHSQNTAAFIPLFKPAAAFLDFSGVGTLLKKLFPGKKLQEDISFVKLPLTVSLFYSYVVLFIFLGGVFAAGITWMIVGEEDQIFIPLAALLGAWVCSSLPGIKLGNMVQERKQKILKALPFSIDLITSAMRGGLDFSAAIRFYVKLGVASPLVDEYTQMLREMELGVIRSTALENMADRIKLKEFTDFVSAIVIGMELGSSLSETLEIQGEEMRKARFALAECKAQKAPSLMLIPMALFIMPAVFIVILTPVFLKMKESGLPFLR
jgi:pilus assembly protein TadC